VSPTVASPRGRRGPGNVRSVGQTIRALLASERFQLALLLTLALLLRLAFHFRSPAFVGKDSQSYFLPGWEIARGLPWELGQRRVPAYPLFIAGSVLTLGEELRSLALAQHLLGVVSVGLTYLLGRLTFGRAAGLPAGLLVALDGPLLIYERYVLSEALFTLLLGLAVLAAVAASGRPTWRRWLLAGATLGLAVLARPVAQALIPLFGLAALLAGGRRWRRGLLGLVALLAGLVLVQGPWVVRNALDKGNPSASTFGRTLIARTAYYDRGFVFDPPEQNQADPLLQQARRIVQDGARQQQSDGVIAGRLRQDLSLDPVEVNRVMREVALDAIRRNPSHFLTGSLAFAWRIFQGQEERLREHWDEYKDANPWDPRIQGLVGGPTPAELGERSTAASLTRLYQPHLHALPLAGLALLGAALALQQRGRRRALIPAAAALGLLLASAALDGPVERYRYPLDPLISVLAVGGLTATLGAIGRLAQRVRPGRRPSGDGRQPEDLQSGRQDFDLQRRGAERVAVDLDR
jgi:dolichyl-phosphate-mannose-protein mannosyltransferase